MLACAMKPRDLEAKLLSWAAALPVVTVTGPRQSGKTTLCRHAFPGKPYVSLEDPDTRMMAQTDPRGFLRRFEDTGAVLDEIQHVPDLLSYLQTLVDADPRPGRFVLTGSQNLSLMSAVSQTLAGRAAVATLLPFSLREAYAPGTEPPLWETVHRGFYPRVLSTPLPPSETLSFYVATYLERDVRSLLRIGDYVRFELFLRLCAGRTGQILNLSDLAADAGISVNTAKSWLSVLETAYIVRRLRPWSANIAKQLSKSPKLYFLDTGLACCLLGIENAAVLETHPLRGPLFETFVVAERWKRLAHAGRPDNLFYYRDSKKREIDLVEETPDGLELCEIKSGATVAADWFAPLEKVAAFLPRVRSRAIVCGGDGALPPPTVRSATVFSWRRF
jgi:hypothetical protein